ncbi:MAG TPA: sensor domain-containing diguanylate cyclase [Patescibacteria group bacterium]|nr:sensor domain-containing diguanylate cyclase [Patescibacteria group bacterium]
MGDDLYKRILDSLYDGVYLVDLDRRTTYWNSGAERITGYRPDEAVGRRCQDNFLVHLDVRGNSLCIHGCPLSSTMANGQPLEVEVYLQHKDGYRIPISVRAAPIRDGTGRVVGAVEVFSDNSRIAAMTDLIKELRQLSLLDHSTEVGNRRFLEQQLIARLNEQDRYGWRVGVLFVDIDHFKEINDRNDHIVGDRVIRMVARTLANGIRSFDIVGRWGGDEFVVLIVNVDEEQLHTVSEKLRRLIENSGFTEGGKTIRVTVSVGGVLAAAGENPEAVIRRADRLMLASKTAGRNRVTIGDLPGPD